MRKTKGFFLLKENKKTKIFLLGLSLILLFAIVIVPFKGFSVFDSFHVTYNANGGENAPKDKMAYTSGTRVNIEPAPDITSVDGKIFIGWSTLQNAFEPQYLYNNDVYGHFDIKQDTVLYAVWSDSAYVQNATVSNGKIVAIQDAVHDGYTFKGWYTQPIGGHLWDFATDTLPETQTNITLYAQWIAKPQFTISYNANGASGSVEDNIQYYYSQQATILAPAGLKDSIKEFTSWNTQANGKGESFSPSDKITITESITLYAQWQVPNYTVFYFDDDNLINTKTVQVGQSVPQLDPSAIGKQLDYWMDDSGNKWDFENNKMPKSNLTLKAVWKNGSVVSSSTSTSSTQPSGGNTDDGGLSTPTTIDDTSLHTNSSNESGLVVASSRDVKFVANGSSKNAKEASLAARNKLQSDARLTSTDLESIHQNALESMKSKQSTYEVETANGENLSGSTNSVEVTKQTTLKLNEIPATSKNALYTWSLGNLLLVFLILILTSLSIITLFVPVNKIDLVSHIINIAVGAISIILFFLTQYIFKGQVVWFDGETFVFAILVAISGIFFSASIYERHKQNKKEKLASNKKDIYYTEEENQLLTYSKRNSESQYT